MRRRRALGLLVIGLLAALLVCVRLWRHGPYAVELVNGDRVAMSGASVERQDGSMATFSAIAPGASVHTRLDPVYDGHILVRVGWASSAVGDTVFFHARGPEGGDKIVATRGRMIRLGGWLGRPDTGAVWTAFHGESGSKP
jgi:hypothetical protein